MFRKATLAAVAVILMVLCYGFVAHNEIAMILGTFMLLGTFIYTAMVAAFDEVHDRH